MSSNLVVMVNGVPGSMGLEVAAACLRRGIELCPVALSGKTSGPTTVYSEVGAGADSARSAEITICVPTAPF